MAAYYNEHDPKAAAWLRELIKGGHIAAGDVDETDIRDVEPSRLSGYTQCHFFAGIGGWSHALRLAGWPDDQPVWTGSCPCQPFSAAGRREGIADERHLWPHWHHLISVCRPSVVFGEQVASKDGLGWLDLVCADMEGSGYAVGAADLCAAGVGAPHIRQRLWFVGLADTDASSERVVRGGDHSLDARKSRDAWSGLGRGCGNGGLADADGEDQRGLGIQRPREGDCAGDGSARERSAGLRPDGGLADAGSRGSAQGLSEPQQRQEGISGEHDDSRSQCAGGQAASSAARPSPTDGHWRDADWLFCRDGKWRPVEPGTFPLAHGVSARVGRLRGYGNAIVPQVAATFIRSVMT